MTTMPLADDALPSRSTPQLSPVSTASEKKREYVRSLSELESRREQLAQALRV